MAEWCQRKGIQLFTPEELDRLRAEGREIRLGAGAYGRCYRLRHSYQDWVLKEFFDKDATEFLKKELQALHHLQGVVGVQELIGVCSFQDIIVTNYAGITLQSFVKRRRRELNEVAVWDVMRQLGKVQVSMAARGFAHNDIKEDNVCIKYSRSGIHLTVIDFGLANLLGKRVYICPFSP